MIYIYRQYCSPARLCTDLIVTELLDPEATCLPSPNQLKRRVLIKHKKIEVMDKASRTATLQKHSSFQKTSSSGSIHVDEDIESFMSDLSNQRKNGYLYMQDPIDKVSQTLEVFMLNVFHRNDPVPYSVIVIMCVDFVVAVDYNKY